MALSATEELSGTSLEDAPTPRPRLHTVLLLVVALTFLLRLALAGLNSYWLDELYSVYLYAVQPDTLRVAIRDLADTSIHPPLYQAVLYVWVALFGDTEVATRTLSNLYVTIGVVFTYGTARYAFGQRTADATAIVLALAFGTMLFGLETRSYAQTLMLSAMSWAAFVLWLAPRERTAPTVPWRGAFFFAANLALLLTHYYNLFLWATQAIFAGLYLAATRRSGPRPTLPWVLGNYVAQLAAFVLIWGRVTYESLEAQREGYEVTVPERSPLAILNALVDHVYWFRVVPTTAIVVLGVGFVTWRFVRRWRSISAERARELLGSGYLLATCLITPVVAYLAFLLVQAERFNARYYLYLVPLIAAAGVVAARELVLLALARFDSPRRERMLVHLRRYAVPYALVFAATVVVAGTLDATGREKDDWRGGAEKIVGIIKADPDNSYAVLETSWRSAPMLNYYLDRKGGMAVDGVILRSEERRGEFSFQDDPELLQGHDRLIVPFIHHATVDFPEAVERLDDAFERHHTHLVNHRGLIIYRLPNG